MSRRQLGSSLALLMGTCMFTASPASAEPEVALETNPLALAFRGASLAARLRAPALPHVAFSAGLYGFTLPRALVDQTAGNADEGWQVAIRPAGYAAADYYLRDHGRGLSFGVAIVLARVAISSEEVAGSTAYQSLYAVPRLGYTQHLWRGLYVTPSVGVEFATKVGGSSELGDRTFTPMTLQPTIGLALGYVIKPGQRRSR